MDIRVKRTYAMLFDALTELLEQKQLDDITVNEICVHSTVHRTTFYKHFEDKYDFYRAYLENLTQTFLAAAPDIDALEDVNEYCHHMLVLLLGFLEGHAGIIKRFAGASSSTALLDMAVEEMTHGIVIRLQAEQTDDARCELGVVPRAVFYAGGLMQTLRWWLNGGRPIGQEDLISLLDSIDLFADGCGS